MQNTSFSVAHPEAQSTNRLPISQITVPPVQISPNELIRLCASIKKYGVLTPITVKRNHQSNVYTPQYIVIDGQKRLAAAKIAEIEQIPCHILEETDADCAINGILHNLRLTKLHFLEQAAAYQLLIKDFALTQGEIAKRLQLSQSTVANRLRLLAFSKDERFKIIDFGITERHARALLRLKTATDRAILLQTIHKEHLSVAETEKIIEEMIQRAPAKQRSQAFQTPNQAVKPRKFALQNLTPLYNSIDRTLDTFRKTGLAATYAREEHEQGVRIIINISTQINSRE